MCEYVSDKDGVWWRKDAFTGFWDDYDSETIHAWINSDHGDDVTVEFDFSEWHRSDSTDPVVVPTPPDYFCVATWVDPSGELHHRCYPMIAWLHGDNWILPITPTDVRDKYPSAILHPNGQVFENEKTWPSLEDYLADRGPELRERERRISLSQRLLAERAKAAKATKPS